MLGRTAPVTACHCNSRSNQDDSPLSSIADQAKTRGRADKLLVRTLTSKLAVLSLAAAAFSVGKERVGQDQPVVRLFPTHECFHAYDVSSLRVNERLVMDGKFVVVERIV